MDTQQPTPELQQKPVIIKQTKSRPAVMVLSVLLIIALAVTGLTGYAWYQEKQKAADAQTQLQTAKKSLENMEAVNIGAGQAAQEAEKMPNFGTFITQYNNFLNNGVTVNQAKEKTAIETALKSYYNLSALPAGWDVLSIYEVVKPQTPPTGDYYAITYLPKSDTKPAGFVPLYKQKGGEWKYDDRR